MGEELQKQGIDVTVLSERKDVLPQGFDPEFETSLKSIECWSRKENFDALVEVAKKEKFDVIHLQHQFGLFPYEDNLKGLYTNLKKLGIKTVTTLHDVIAYDFRSEPYFQTIINYSDKIIVHTESCQNLMLGAWRCPKEKLSFILHGTKLIDVLSKTESRQILNLPQTAKIILSWGFIWESKGIIELVEIFAELLKTYPEAILIHAGGLHPVFSRGDYLKNILKKAYGLGVRPQNFRITGFINEEQIKLYFGACDIGVLNFSRGSASASGSAHRILASGKALVGTDDPCLDDIPKYVVNRGDKQGLLRGILKVLIDEKLQKELIEKELKVAEKTSWKNTALLHKELYEGVNNKRTNTLE